MAGDARDTDSPLRHPGSVIALAPEEIERSSIEMAVNTFEESRVAAGTLNRRGQKPGIQGSSATEESSAISRDDVRDGFESPQVNARRVLSAGTLAGERVRNQAGEDLGAIEEIMLDIPSGRIAYAVLSFGGFLGMGGKLFAVPWSALQLDESEHEFILNVDRKMLENAPGFDKDSWPDMTDPAFAEAIHQHYYQSALINK
jgi:sporulation protein YlmC with PRC-barrel domain